MLDPSCVSHVELTAPEQSIANLYADPKGEYQPATMRFSLCGDEPQEFGPLNVTFRLKGSGSFRTLDGKAAFKIKMPSGNRIDGLKSLTLNNMVQDPSAMHEVLAYEAFRGVGVRAPRVGYATVTLNGAAYGIYANVETPDGRFLAANFATTQHLYEAPDWTLGFIDESSRDIVPESVPNFEVDEGDDESLGDLENLAQLTEIADDTEWWTAFQERFDTEQVLKFWAAEFYLGNHDNFVAHVNNYYLHSNVAGVFNFLPWGADQTFTTAFDLAPYSSSSEVVTRCLNHSACRAAYLAALDSVGEQIIALDLVGEAHKLYAVAAGAVAADPRREAGPAQHCRAADSTIAFLIAREELWRTQYREPGSGIVSAQSSTRLECPGDEPVAVPGVAAHAAVAINDGERFTRSRRVSLTLSWPQGATSVEVSNDSAFAAKRSFAHAASVPWTLAKHTRRTRSVFVRFLDSGGGVIADSSDTILLDDSAPVVAGVTARAAARANRAALRDQPRERRGYRLTVAARDSGSGVESVQVQTFRGHRTKLLPYADSGRVELLTAAKRVRLRVVDRAGNVGAWTTVPLPR